jgi:hypothetical protein
VRGGFGLTGFLERRFLGGFSWHFVGHRSKALRFVRQTFLQGFETPPHDDHGALLSVRERRER